MLFIDMSSETAEILDLPETVSASSEYYSGLCWFGGVMRDNKNLKAIAVYYKIRIKNESFKPRTSKIVLLNEKDEEEYDVIWKLDLSSLPVYFEPYEEAK